MKGAAALLALALVAGLAFACAGSDEDAIARLRGVAAFQDGIPALVFVYTDG